ncbi:MAG TPA: MlaD family protein, partial [Thiolinea sp.]|nr:MlaD family protein [Thiolinea sp.]
QLEVGEVIDYRLVEDTGRIELTVFINEPFYRFITANTRFWNASGFDLRVDTSGAEFHMESLSTLIAGGIAFETPPDENTDHAISADGTHFVLYRNYAGSRERHYANRLYYTLYFDGSLRGLSEGATVEYQGIRVGQVEKIKLYYDQDSNDLRTPVLISIEPERFADDIDLERAPTLIREMVEKGLRAQLRSGSILTDLLYVALVFDPNAEKGSISSGQFYDIFPVDNQPTENVAMAMSALSLELQETVKKVNRFLEQGKLDETVGNVNGVLEETRSTMSKAGAALTDAQRLIRQLDQKTVPGLSSDISRVAERLDTQTLPMLTRDVSRVAERLDTQTLPQLSRNLNVLTERLDRETLPQLADNMTRITGTVNNALQRTTVSAEKVTGAVGRISGDFAKTTEALNKTLVRLQNTMGHLDRLLARNSPTQYQLDQMMQEVTLMSRSLRTLAETLQKQPESVLRGKREQ